MDPDSESGSVSTDLIAESGFGSETLKIRAYGFV